MMTMQAVKPWYKEPWPWYLMAGPFIVVVASTITAWFAVTTSDGLVTDDYYKKGLVIDQTLARSRLAESMGLELKARFTSDGVVVALQATTDGAAFTPPKSLTLTLSHPTRAGLDQQVSLQGNGSTYSSNLRLPASGHWLVLLEDDAQTWRVMGNVVLPAQGDVVIGGVDAAK